MSQAEESENNFLLDEKTADKENSFIALETERYELFGDDSVPVLQMILEECSVRTLQRWWLTYLEWGELPYYAKEREKELTSHSNKLTIDDNKILQLMIMIYLS